MYKDAVIDVGEFARFTATGVAATLANLAAVWAVTFYQPFNIALLAGIAAGATMSFLLSKWFAFRSRTWDQTRGEAGRFLMVYAVGCTAYWSVAMIAKSILRKFGMSSTLEDLLSALIGAGVMMFKSYFGHRFFTYRTHLPGRYID